MASRHKAEYRAPSARLPAQAGDIELTAPLDLTSAAPIPKPTDNRLHSDVARQKLLHPVDVEVRYSNGFGQTQFDKLGQR